MRIYSSDLRTSIDALESKRIERMASACYAGGFLEDLDKEGILIITSSDEEHTSNSCFQEYFFEGVLDLEMNDLEAFEYAESWFNGMNHQIANPLANWRAWHCFFGH